jgi:TolB protein
MMVIVPDSTAVLSPGHDPMFDSHQTDSQWFTATREALTSVRAVFVAALTSIAFLAVSPPASAQFRVEISGVGATQLPIAIAKFRDEERSTPSLSISGIVRADLERSGVFRSVDAPEALDETSQPVMADWRSRAADALAVGSVSRLADGRFDVRFKLWDVVKGNAIAAQSMAVDAADLRLAAHRIADTIYEKLTGDKGVFSTRIAYVTKGGGNRYTLRVSDADGEGGQVALNSPEPIISPAWSPDGKQLAYVSFEKQKAVVYVQDTSTGARREIANFRGSNSAPAWSPDGQTLAVTLSRESGSQLYLIDRNGGNVRRLTNSSAIDTEPKFAPDGRGIYFVSDRGGGPQIYRTSVSGGNVERVTFGGNYNISPSISPDGRTLAYISRQGGAFRLYTLDLSSAGAQPVALTDTNDDESPSFAPNGRLIIYASRAQGRDVLMTTTLDGKIKARLASTNTDVREPVWGPFGR